MKAIIFNLGGTLVDLRQDMPQLHAHVTELLPILYSLGHTLAATIPEDMGLIEHLDTGNIRHYFTTIVTPHHLSSEQPYAESVTVALRHLNSEPGDTILVGDTVGMVIAAKNAGLNKVIGVIHGHGNPTALTAAGADYVVADIPSILDVIE
jgi:phosphoglycolate phosphatase-like HAD superfamily hydrolase